MFLAFTADDSWTKPIVVGPGARVQSLPEPGEPPVLFETDAPLVAQAALNVLLPRTARPAYLPRKLAASVALLHFAGTATRLLSGAALLLSYGETSADQVVRFVATVAEDFAADRTAVELVGGTRPDAGPAPVAVDLDVLISELDRLPSLPPASPARLSAAPGGAFGTGSTAVDALVRAFHPQAADAYARVRANVQVTARPELQAVSAFRVKAFIYGHTAPLPPVTPVIEVAAATSASDDWTLAYPDLFPPEGEELTHFRRRVLDLDTTYDAIRPDTWVAVELPSTSAAAGSQAITKVERVETASRTDYNLPGKVTRLVLTDPWLPEDPGEDGLRLFDFRSTVVHAAPEALAPADEPVESAVCGDELELDRQAPGLEPGRWVVVTGERVVFAVVADGPDVAFETGVEVSELSMVSTVRQDTLWVDGDGNVVPPSQLPADAGDGEQSPPVPLPGDKVHTFLQLAAPLAYCYERRTVRVHANVAHATHGETHEEPLGSGDASQAFQSFTLKSGPLTYVSAPTTSGVDSSLRVYVNDVRWHEAESLLDLGAADHGYLTAADAAGATSVTFGDGRTGARLPRGVENVRATYRSGIGEAGNVRAGQLSQLVTRTDGLRGVTNPQRASGGADSDGPDRTRSRAPLTAAALDRLVATRDYADFALLSAGVGKASAARLASRHGQLVHVTVAGVDDIPVDESSDLRSNLVEALERYGDPFLPVRVAPRELLALVVAARVRIDADHVWDVVRGQLEAALLARFGFDARDLAQDAYAAEALAALQAVTGVDYVDLDLFTAVPETTPVSRLAGLGSTLTGVHERVAALPDRNDPKTLAPLPAQLAVLLAGEASTVFLTEIAGG